MVGRRRPRDERRRRAGRRRGGSRAAARAHRATWTSTRRCPDRKRAALDAVVYGQAAKLFVRPPDAPCRRAPRCRCPAASGVTRSSGPDGRPASRRRLVRRHAAGNRRARRRAGAGALDRRAGRAAPRPAARRRAGLVVTWHDDPWALGAYSARSLASPMDDEELPARSAAWPSPASTRRRAGTA